MTPMQLLKLQNEALIEVDERVSGIETDARGFKGKQAIKPRRIQLLNGQVSTKRVRTIKEVRKLDLQDSWKPENYIHTVLLIGI